MKKILNREDNEKEIEHAINARRLWQEIDDNAREISALVDKLKKADQKKRYCFDKLKTL